MDRNHSSYRGRSGFLPPSPEVHTLGRNAKMGTYFGEFPVTEALAQSMKSVLFFVSPLVNTLLVISLSLLIDHKGANTVLHNQWEKKGVGVFWWFAEAGLFVLLVSAVSRVLLPGSQLIMNNHLASLNQS